jgi:hypothetical protein
MNYKRIFSYLFIQLTIIFFVVSCDNQNDQYPVQQETTTPVLTTSKPDLPSIKPTDVTTARAISLTADDILKVIPAPIQLNQMGLGAQNLINNVKSKNYTKAKEDLVKIKNASDIINPLLRVTPTISITTIDGLNNTINMLEKELNSKKSYETRVQANLITKYVNDISDNYRNSSPINFQKMIYYAREIELNNEKDDFANAKTNYEQMNKLFTNTKSLLDSTYSNDILAFETMLDKLRKDIDIKNNQMILNDLNVIFDKVDVLMSDFSKQQNM